MQPHCMRLIEPGAIAKSNPNIHRAFQRLYQRAMKDASVVAFFAVRRAAGVAQRFSEIASRFVLRF